MVLATSVPVPVRPMGMLFLGAPVLAAGGGVVAFVVPA